MEIWKTVVGNCDYEVSTLGRVKRVTTAKGATAGRILKPGLGSHGYLGVSLGRNNHHLVHRLMAAAFLPPGPGKTHVNHINGDKTDNRIENLEWSNKSLNQIHAMKLGLYAGPPLKRGVAQGNAKLTDDDVRLIRLKRAAGAQYQHIASEFGVSQSLAFYVCHKGWKHVT
jgi:hypothetical protein